jgi:hypothetical protein
MRWGHSRIDALRNQNFWRVVLYTVFDASRGWLNRRTERIAALKQGQHERAIDLA